MTRNEGPTPPKRLRDRVIFSLPEFLREESGGGVVLLAAAVLALVWANSPLSGLYDDVWHADIRLGVGPFAITETIQHWINDGLMTIFFFVVGLEIKRELVTGELRDPKAAALPVVAALGGMVVPAAVYLSLNAGGAGSHGWGIPMATDIAFALGVLAVLGPRVPSGLKLFVLTLAIVDDIGAILVIAAFYTRDLDVAWLGAAVGCIAATVVLRTIGVPWPIAYVPFAAIGWFAAYSSGIHPTIAGVAVALITPAHPVRGREVLLELEDRLHPVSSYAIVPLFALANAGVSLRGPAAGDAAATRVLWGVALGLVAGKTIGIAAASLAAVRLRIGRLPAGVRASHIVGAGALGGIGFTVSLFVTALAFRDGEYVAAAKIGVLAGSLASAAIGSAILFAAARRDRRRAP